jgi:hypothetical protein
MDYEFYMPENPKLVAMGDAFEYVVKSISKTFDGIRAETESFVIKITDRDYYIQKKISIPLYALLFGNYGIKYDGKDKLKFTVAGVELSDGDGKIIRPDGFAYINGTPKMPQLKARIQPSGIATDVKWQMKIEYGKDNRIDSDTFPSSGPKSLSAGTSWNIGSEFGNLMRGGKATISWQYSGMSSPKDFQFNIRGTNPTKNDAKAYVGTSPWFIKGIVSQESGYLQFNETGKLGSNWSDYKYCPLWGPPHGWGMMQIDPKGQLAPVAVLWDWKANVDKGKEVLQGKYDEKYSGANDFWARQVVQFEEWKATYPDAPLPANTTFNGITFAYAPVGSQKSYEDAVWIKQYNGAYGGNYIAWNNTNPLDSKWVFHRLNNDLDKGGYDYVERVCNKLP